MKFGTSLRDTLTCSNSSNSKVRTYLNELVSVSTRQSIEPLGSQSHQTAAELKVVHVNAATELQMLRVEYTEDNSSSSCAIGALLRVRNEEEAEDVYFLVTHYSALPSSALSALRRLHLQTPDGHKWDGIPREWVHCVSTDEERRTSLVQLAQPAVDAMLAAGVTCRAIGTAADGMSATNECVTRDAAGGFTQTSERLRVFYVWGREAQMFRESRSVRTARRRRRQSAGGVAERWVDALLVGGDRKALFRGSHVEIQVPSCVLFTLDVWTIIYLFTKYRLAHDIYCY